MNRRRNGSLDPRRWRRARQAERELLALLDADPNEVTRVNTPATPHAASCDQALDARVVFPMELENR
jgi:hypothetical protein